MIGGRRVQSLLEAADSNPPEIIRPCNILKLLNFLKLKKACGTDGIPNEPSKKATVSFNPSD
jgi:hypothetical protein